MLDVIETTEEFKSFVDNVRDSDGYRDPIGFGITRVDVGQANSDKVLQATYPVINWKENFGSAAVFIAALKDSGVEVDFGSNETIYNIDSNFITNAMALFSPYAKDAKGDLHKNIQVVAEIEKNFVDFGCRDGEYRVVFIYDDVAIESVEVAYLKLYALSLGKVELRSLNLNGAFGVLENVAWSGSDPLELDWLRENEISLKLSASYPVIDYIDKFPRFLMHVIPADNTRILDSSKVRFGAQLAAGTTVMPGASYINFNAGTTGASMVEGRISSSAIVQDGSDVGGGASILGVLSGTNGNPVTIGKNCLLGANSVTGIPLGDGCIVDAGIAVLEGTKFIIDTKNSKEIAEVNKDFVIKEDGIYKGLELASLNGIHYRQNSTTGAMVALRSKREVKLNTELH